MRQQFRPKETREGQGSAPERPRSHGPQPEGSYAQTLTHALPAYA